MALRGGERDRAIMESLLREVEAELTTRGWFGAGRAHSPITLIQGFPDEKEQVAPNTIAISGGDGKGFPQEMGSKHEIWRSWFYFDMFSDSESVAIDVMGDIYAFLKENDVIAVRDYSQAGAPVDFTVWIDNTTVSNRRPDRPTNPWQRHWRTVDFVLEDERPNS